VIAGASAELQKEVLDILFETDFEEKIKSKFACFAKRYDQSSRAMRELG
jgi:hypothetical protein